MRFHRCVCSLLLALLPSFAGSQALTFEPFEPGGIYELGEHAGWRVTAQPGQQPPKTSLYTYTVKKNALEVIQHGTLDVSKPATIDVVVNDPAMLYVEVKPANDAAATPQVVGAAIAPEKIESAEPEPPDFDRFWRDKIALLAKIPANPVLTPKPSEREGVEYFTLQM